MEILTWLKAEITTLFLRKTMVVLTNIYSGDMLRKKNEEKYDHHRTQANHKSTIPP